MYYTVTKHGGHMRTRGKHKPQESVFYIFRVFLNVQSVFHSVIHGLGFFIFLWFIWYRFCMRRTIKHAVSMFYTLIKHGFLTNHSSCRVLFILQLNINTGKPWKTYELQGWNCCELHLQSSLKNKFFLFELYSFSIYSQIKFSDFLSFQTVTKASLVEENRLVCPVPVLNNTER